MEHALFLNAVAATDSNALYFEFSGHIKRSGNLGSVARQQDSEGKEREPVAKGPGATSLATTTAKSIVSRLTTCPLLVPTSIAKSAIRTRTGRTSSLPVNSRTAA